MDESAKDEKDDVRHESRTRDSEYSDVVLDEVDLEPTVTIHEIINQAEDDKEDTNHANAELAASLPVNDANNDDKSVSGSSASSPVPPSPHKTRFSVTVQHAKECTGEIITYRVTSKRLFDDKGAGNEGRVYQVMRVYEDFEFLDQCLIMAAFAGQCYAFNDISC